MRDEKDLKKYPELAKYDKEIDEDDKKVKEEDTMFQDFEGAEKLYKKYH